MQNKLQTKGAEWHLHYPSSTTSGFQSDALDYHMSTNAAKILSGNNSDTCHMQSLGVNKLIDKLILPKVLSKYIHT